MTFERWTKKKPEDNADVWEDSSSGKARAGQKVKEGLRPAAGAPGLARGRSSPTQEAGPRAAWGGVRAWGRAHGEPRTNDGGLESRGPGNGLRVWLEPMVQRPPCRLGLGGRFY